MQIQPVKLSLPFRLSEVNAYLLRANGRAALVDTGLDPPESRQQMTDGLAAFGLTPADIDTVFVTHYHGDHWCLAPWFQRAGAEVVMPFEDHRLLRLWIETPTIDDDMLDHHRKNGVPEPLLRSVGEAMVGIRKLSPPLRADRLVEDREIVDLCGEPFQVLITPGHTPGHACIQHIPTRTLLCGDHVLPEITPNITPSFGQPDADPLTDYRAALRRLRGRGFGVAHPAHGPAMPDLDRRIDELLAHHDQREADALALLDERPRTALHACRGLFKLTSLDGWETLMALGETEAHLTRLVNRGEVEKTVGPPTRYRRA